MNILIDTQSLIWFYENDSALSQNAKQAIENPQNERFVSMATFWEMSIKMNLKKLSVKGLTLQEFMEEVKLNAFLAFSITKTRVIQNGKLPFHHKDPFDRMIISQAIVEDMPIVSSDAAFDLYPIQRIW